MSDFHYSIFQITYLFFCIIQSTSRGFSVSSAGQESACNAGDPGSIPGSGRSPGEGKGYPLHYSGLVNSTNCTVHGVAKSWTLSDFCFCSVFCSAFVSANEFIIFLSSFLQFLVPVYSNQHLFFKAFYFVLGYTD